MRGQRQARLLLASELVARSADVVSLIADSEGEQQRSRLCSSVVWMLAHAGDGTECGSHSRLVLRALEAAGVRDAMPSVFQVTRLPDESLAAEAERACRRAIDDESADEAMRNSKIESMLASGRASQADTVAYWKLQLLVLMTRIAAWGVPTTFLTWTCNEGLPDFKAAAGVPNDCRGRNWVNMRVHDLTLHFLRQFDLAIKH